MVPIKSNTATSQPQWIVWKKQSEVSDSDQVYMPSLSNGGSTPIKVVPFKQGGKLGIASAKGLNGLGLFKSRARKEAEKELPILQQKVTEQAQLITQLNQQIVQLQKVIQTRDQTQVAIQQQSNSIQSPGANTTASIIPGLDNTMLYVGAGIIAVLGLWKFQQSKSKSA